MNYITKSRPFYQKLYDKIKDIYKQIKTGFVLERRVNEAIKEKDIMSLRKQLDENILTIHKI